MLNHLPATPISPGQKNITMKYFFEDQFGVEQIFDNVWEARAAARKDPTVEKFRDTDGGEYYGCDSRQKYMGKKI